MKRRPTITSRGECGDTSVDPVPLSSNDSDVHRTDVRVSGIGKRSARKSLGVFKDDAFEVVRQQGPKQLLFRSPRI